MDEDKLNKQLNDRIRDVFDHYEDTSADEGWAMLRQKFPVEKKDRGMAWLWYAAAAIVLLGIGLWFMLPAEQVQQVANNGQLHQKPSVITDEIKKDSLSNSASQLTDPLNTTAAQRQQAVVTNNGSASRQPLTSSPVKATASVNIDPAIVSNTQKANTNTRPEQILTDNRTAVETERYAVAANAKADGANEQVKIDSPARNTEVIAKNNGTAKQPPLTSAEAMARMLAMDKPQADKIGPKKGDKKTVIGIYAGTFFNYADGSENRVNVGGGVTTDVSISRNFKLSTGVSIAQNSLNYNYDVYKGSELYAAALNVGLDAKSAALSYSAPIPKSYRASLIGLDVPINLKYQFDPKRNDTYVSAGVSSGTFLNETYVLDYNVGTAKEQTTTQAKFSEFYLAKTLNVSFGVGYPLGKSNRLVIEPFLKYPLGGLGTQQIKFGSGGVNLKLNFSGGK